MKNVYIKSIGYYVPEGRMTNQDILDRFTEENKGQFDPETFDLLLYGNQRKFDFLGLKTRSCSRDDSRENYVSMAVTACERAIEKANLSVDQIDCILFSGVSNPFYEPSFAIVLANSLGMTTGDFFDINDTCNGFLKSIDVASLYLETGRYRNILIAACESPYELEKRLNLGIKLQTQEDNDNRLGGLIVGSGAAAMVVSSEGASCKITHYAEHRETTNWDASLLTIPQTTIPDSTFGNKLTGFWSNGRLISASIIKDMPVFINQALETWGIAVDAIDLFIMHQLGNNITFAIMDKIGADHAKAPVNTFQDYGNMATVNLPVNLAMADEQNLLSPGDSVLLLSSSCGISYTLTHIQW